MDHISEVLRIENAKSPLHVQVITSTVPIKDPYFATIKSTNYLPNALVVTEAEEQGASVGIWLDEEGHLAEGQNMNVGFLTTEGELLLPPFDRILSGCTARRLLELAPKLVKENAIAGLTGVRMTTISVAEGRKAAEMMLIMSGYLIVPVVEWDGKPVGNGKFLPETFLVVLWNGMSRLPIILCEVISAC